MKRSNRLLITLGVFSILLWHFQPVAVQATSSANVQSKGSISFYGEIPHKEPDPKPPTGEIPTGPDSPDSPDSPGSISALPQLNQLRSQSQWFALILMILAVVILKKKDPINNY